MAEKLAAENNLEDTGILAKYKLAADIVNEAENFALATVVPNVSIADLCCTIDDFIVKKLSTLAKKYTAKGTAFPTCISPNNYVGHLAPTAEDKPIMLSPGDVVKIDIGVQVDGYIAQKACSMVLSQDTISDRRADVITATYEAAENVLRAIKGATINNDLTDIIENVAKRYGCKPVEGVLSHQIQRHTIDGEKVILNRRDVDAKVDDATMQLGEVYVIDIILSTGEGKPKDSGIKSSIYKRSTEAFSQLKLKVSRALLAEIDKRHPIFPFHLRSFDDIKGNIGINEIQKHHLVHTFPILIERSGTIIAQVKFTVMLLNNGQGICHTPFVLPENVKVAQKQIE